MKRIVFILVCFPFLAFAQSGLIDNSRTVEENQGDYQGSVSSGSQSEYQTSDTEGQELGGTGGFQTTQQGGLDGTTGAQSDGLQVLVLGVAMGKMFQSACGPHNAWACYAAGMAFADAMAGGSAQSAAYQTGTYIDPTAGYDGDTGGVDPSVQQDIDNAVQDLNDAGYTINADGSVSGPNGTMTAEDLKNADNMVANGASPEEASKFQEQMSQVQAAAAKKAGIKLPDGSEGEGQAVGSVDGGGGSGFGAGDSSTGGAISGADGLIEEIEIRGKKKGRGLAEDAASKLSKNFNGDPIGIGLGNLFMIVEQKYDSEDSKRRFFNREIVNKGK